MVPTKTELELPGLWHGSLWLIKELGVNDGVGILILEYPELCMFSSGPRETRVLSDTSLGASCFTGVEELGTCEGKSPSGANVGCMWWLVSSFGFTPASEQTIVV